MNRPCDNKETRKGVPPLGAALFLCRPDWLRRRPKYAAGSDRAKDTDRYDGYLALKLQHSGAVWLRARGYSMLTVFIPMEQVKVVPLTDTISLGQVVVFNQGAKLTAHRIVGHRTDGIGWIAKGDTLSHFDSPLSDTAVIGVVEEVRGWRGRRRLEPDAPAARLSSNLACKLFGYREKRPSLLVSCLYLIVFGTLYPFRRWSATQRLVAVTNAFYNH